MATEDVKVWNGSEWVSLKGEPGPQEVSADSGNLTTLGSDLKVYTQVTTDDVQGLGTIATKAEGDYLPITGGKLNSNDGVSTVVAIESGGRSVLTLKSAMTPQLRLTADNVGVQYTFIGGATFAIRRTDSLAVTEPFQIDSSGYFTANHYGRVFTSTPASPVNDTITHFGTGRAGTYVSAHLSPDTKGQTVAALQATARVVRGIYQTTGQAVGSTVYFGSVIAVQANVEIPPATIFASFVGFQVVAPVIEGSAFSGCSENVGFSLPKQSLFGWYYNTGISIDWDENVSGSDGLGVFGVPLSRPNYAIRCEGTARVLFNGKLELGSGQLEFPATPNPSANPNTLDDYEEGSWLPGLAAHTTNPQVTYSVRSGTYVKVGGMVHLWGRIQLNGLGDPGAGRLSITGLPFPIKAGTFGTGSVGSMSGWGAVEWPERLGFSSGSAISILAPGNSNSAFGQVLLATALTASSLITFHISYCTE